MYDKNPETLKIAIESAVKDVRMGLLHLTNDSDPTRYQYSKSIGLGGDQLFVPVMKELGLSAGETLKSTAGRDSSRKTEWVATSNPNVIIMQEFSSDNGADWNMTSRDLIVAGFDWLRGEELK